MLPDSRKLLVDAKQRKVHVELTFERLPELFFLQEMPKEKVDADGFPPVILGKV